MTMNLNTRKRKVHSTQLREALNERNGPTKRDLVLRATIFQRMWGTASHSHMVCRRAKQCALLLALVITADIIRHSTCGKDARCGTSSSSDYHLNSRPSDMFTGLFVASFLVRAMPTFGCIHAVFSIAFIVSAPRLLFP